YSLQWRTSSDSGSGSGGRTHLCSAVWLVVAIRRNHHLLSLYPTTFLNDICTHPSSKSHYTRQRCRRHSSPKTSSRSNPSLCLRRGYSVGMARLSRGAFSGSAAGIGTCHRHYRSRRGQRYLVG